MLLWSCAEEVASPPSVSHPPEWNNQAADNFHGKKVLANITSGLDPTGTISCQSCHGEDFNGGKSGVSCYDCHANFPHPPDWIDKNADNYHGDVVYDSGTESCKPCHGENLDGGPSGVACADCHGGLFPHPDGWINAASQNFHGVFIRNDNWSMSGCQGCHGVDYAGGGSGVSCLTCHSETNGPQACNTCHGNFSGPVSDLTNWAPPEDLEKNINTGSKGVGAHQVHLNPMNIASVNELGCLQCHRELRGFGDPNHIKGGVNLQWHPIATDSGRVTPLWSATNATCGDVYCHGNFEFSKESSAYQFAYTADAMTGNNPELTWTEVGTGQAACGTCHGLPPTGHIPQQLSDCHGCHGSVVDENGNIIDTTKHINGKINVFD